MRGAWGLTSVSLAVMALLWPSAAQAAMPGQNGRVAFHAAGQISTVNSDGSGLTQVGAGAEPAWSPDGTRLVFKDGVFFKIMNADGSGATTSIDVTYGSDPIWSPDGERIAFVLDRPDDDFVEFRSFPDEIVVMNSDGTGQTQITEGVCARAPDFFPPCDEIMSLSWEPGGSRIAFTRAHWFVDQASEEEDYFRGENHVAFVDAEVPGSETLMPNPGFPLDSVDWEPTGQRLLLSGSTLALVLPDGTGYYPLQSQGWNAEWSPDGTKLIYATNPSGGDIYTREVDGTSPVPVVMGQPATDPTWQPVQPPVRRGYVRPKAATPFKSTLVPAYRQCVPSNENRSHGPPLGFRSCAPPAQSSGFLTVGTADSNGMPAKSWGVVQLDVMAGNPATPADEADVEAVVGRAELQNTPEPPSEGELLGVLERAL